MIETKNLSKSFKNKVVLDNLNISFDDGEIIGIIGKNGTGKTTLIKLLTRVLKPTSGDIFYNSKNIKEYGNKLYNQIGVVLEGSRNIYWYLTGIQNIHYYGGLYGLSKKEIDNRAIPLLKRFELLESKDQTVDQYSRGMKQKLSIIIAMLNNPTVLFLDEPTLGLDILTKKNLIDILSNLSKENNITIIITSHELSLIEEICNKIVILGNDNYKVITDIFKFKDDYLIENVYSILCKKSSDNFELKDIPFFDQLKIEEDNDILKLNISDKEFDMVPLIITYLSSKKVVIYSISNKGNNLEDIVSRIWSTSNESN
jgi:ABC-2 type transport system ATP-binding protein